MEDWSQHRWSEAANWLRTREASQWLDDPAPTERMLRRMQRELAEWQIILVIALRETACRVPQKFPTHPNLLATPLALEQASDWGIAAYKAVRFAGRPVVDMCCGMGGDLVALALQHRAENGTCHGLMGVEQNPLLAVVAAENVRRVTGCDVEVRNESCLETRTGDWWLHIDPDRRPNFESRVSRTELYQPSWQQLLPLIAASPGGGVKIAPAAELDSTEWDSPELDTCDAPTSADWEREWIESGGQCRQQMVWWKGAARNAGRRRAARVDAAGELCGEWTEQQPGLDRVVGTDLGEYLYEPSPALLAAELVDDIAAGLDLGRIAAGAVYLTGRHVNHPLLSSFRIRETLPLDRKKLIAHIRQCQPRAVEVKKRGVDDFDPNEMQRLFKKKKCLGTRVPLVVIATRLGSRRLAIVAERADTVSH